MSVEKIKTIILIFLVGLSVVLTGILWFGFRPLPAVNLTPAEDPVQLGLAKETIDLLIPIRALVSLEDQNFALLEPDSPLFQEGWEQVVGRMQQENLWLLHPSWKPAPDPPDLTAPGTWQWEFPLAFSLDHWHDLLRHEGGDSGTAPAMAKLVLTPGGEAYVCDEAGTYYPWGLDLRLPLPGAADLPLYRRPEVEGCTIAPGIYVPAEELQLPVMWATVENLPAESVASTFFVDMSLVRKIKERDEAVIYTDGQRALRLYPSGALEYNFPSLQEKTATLSFPTAWERGRLFVEQHGGWPPEIRAGEVAGEVHDGGQHIRINYYQYQKGIPLRLPEPALSLYVNSGGVVVYERLVVTPYLALPPHPLVDPQELLEDAVRGQDQEGEGNRAEVVVTDISLAYFGRPEGGKEYILEPAWIIEIDGEQFFYAAQTGKPLSPPGAEGEKEVAAWTGAGLKIS
jgi:regulatory protein YycH of two-component signal transduction system YycFG